MSNNSDETLLQVVGLRIRELRNQKGLSLKDLAYKIGMESSNLSVIENGRSNPQLITFAKIASALEINLSDLFEVEFDFKDFYLKPSSFVPRKHNSD